MINVWRRSKFLFSLTQDKKDHDKCLKLLHGFTQDIVKKRRQTITNDEGDVSKLDEEDFGIKRRMALLDVLLKSTVDDGRPLTNEEISEEVDTFMFEGHDTVTSALSFALYSLSRNSRVQKKVYEEVTRIVGEDCSIFPTYQQLSEMKYVELCIKETLRLFPPVPMYGRNLDEDVLIDENTTIPAGSNFNLMIFHTNKDPKYFPNPNDFIPERFNDENEKSENHFVYVPFSAGARNCRAQKKFE
jgi:cytochrome P450 family 4